MFFNGMIKHISLFIKIVLDVFENVLTGTVMFRDQSGETKLMSSIIVYILKQIFCATSRPFSNTRVAGPFIHHCSSLGAFTSNT